MRGFHQGTRAYSSSTRCRIHDCNLSFMSTAIFHLQCGADHIWIKQHLRIKSFFGASQNAVKTQVWIAVSVYVLVAIIKKRLDIKASLYSILQILSVTTFETIPIDQLLTGCDHAMKNDDFINQLNLFD